MAAPGYHEELVKVSQKVIGLAALLNKTSPLGSLDAALDRVLSRLLNSSSILAADQECVGNTSQQVESHSSHRSERNSR